VNSETPRKPEIRTLGFAGKASADSQALVGPLDSRPDHASVDVSLSRRLPDRVGPHRAATVDAPGQPPRLV
jgi:hypothetical protein